jgi:hypothetical protein
MLVGLALGALYLAVTRVTLETAFEANYAKLLAVKAALLVALLAVGAQIQGFNVEKLTVTLLPLPYVKFTIAPSDAPRGPEASRVLMAIDRLNQRLQ